MKLILLLIAVMMRSINLNLLSALDDKVTQSSQPPRSCADLKASGERVNGVYTVFDENDDGTSVESRIFCDFRKDEGWTVIMRRCDGSVEFYRNWNDYKKGFGDHRREFWIGNDYLHFVTGSKHKTQLRVELTDLENVMAYAEYDDFSLSDESTNNRLARLGNYHGTAGDSLSDARTSAFSTFDRNNDGFGCATLEHGAWWFTRCGNSVLTAIHNCTKALSVQICNEWVSWKPAGTPFKTVEMKIRRAPAKQMS